MWLLCPCCTGSEWNYVILSTVRSQQPEFIEAPKPKDGIHKTRAWCNKMLGIITDRHQINVAITRARMGLVIIGQYD